MDLQKLLKAYKPPFVCDDEAAMVVDQDNYAVIVVRGWSRLNPMFGHDEAFNFQLQLAHFVADKLNELANPSALMECKENNDDDGPTASYDD